MLYLYVKKKKRAIASLASNYTSQQIKFSFRSSLGIWMCRLCGSDPSLPCSVWHLQDTSGGGGGEGLVV